MLLTLCILAGCMPAADTSMTEDMPAGTSLQAYCTESQQNFLEQTKDILPDELVFHDWTETSADYKTTDTQVISGILQELRKVTVTSKSPVASTDSQGLEFMTTEGDACIFWFEERRFKGADGSCYVLSGDGNLWKLVQEVREVDLEHQP